MERERIQAFASRNFSSYSGQLPALIFLFKIVNSCISGPSISTLINCHRNLARLGHVAPPACLCQFRTNRCCTHASLLKFSPTSFDFNSSWNFFYHLKMSEFLKRVVYLFIYLFCYLFRKLFAITPKRRRRQEQKFRNL